MSYTVPVSAPHWYKISVYVCPRCHWWIEYRRVRMYGERPSEEERVEESAISCGCEAYYPPLDETIPRKPIVVVDKNKVDPNWIDLSINTLALPITVKKKVLTKWRPPCAS